MRRTLLAGFRLAVVAAVAAAPWLSSPACAKSMSLYVRKAEIASTQRNGVIYAPAAAVLKAMGFDWSVEGSTLRLSAGTTGGPAVPAASSLTVVLPSGRTVEVAAISAQNETWVSVRPLAEAAGGTYIATPAAGIVQVAFPPSAISQRDLARAVRDAKAQAAVAGPPSTSWTPPASGAPSKTADGGEKAAADTTAADTNADAGNKTADAGDTTADAGDKTADAGDKTADGKKKEDPIKVTNLDYLNPIIPGSKVPAELRGTATITNTSKKRVTNVRFTVEFLDQGENPVASQPTQYISAMEPGESSTQDFLWYNYYNQFIQVKVKIEHDEPPKPKKKEEKAGDATTSPDGGTPAAPSGSDGAAAPPAGGTTK